MINDSEEFGKCEVRVLEERGLGNALLGMRFSHKVECSLAGALQEYDVFVPKIAYALAKKDGGHNKFLEFIDVWVVIRYPLKFWKHMDTYRVGVSKLSKSTMHSIMKRDLMRSDFTHVHGATLKRLNALRAKGDFDTLTDELPEAYLQTRMIKLSYKTIRAIVLQRRGHKLKEWESFIGDLLSQLASPTLLGVDPE